MIMSRGLALTRITNNGVKNVFSLSRGINKNKQIVRYSHGTYIYRKCPGFYSKKDYFKADVIGGIIWWWVLWHCFTDYEELIGHSMPDPSEWTDEELGIPPEDE